MKRTVVILFFIVLFLMFSLNTKKEYNFKDIIRFRIIANSNKKEDQDMKWNINKDIIPIISSIEKSATSKEEIKLLANKNIPNMENKIKKYTDNYKINYGENYFPEKNYNGYIIPEGNYESLVITLGNGKGDNWWCMLFPPLCLIEAEKNNTDEVIYTTYINKIINTYL